MNARLLLASLVLSGSAHAQSMAPPPIVELDRIVAIVNEDVIVSSELNGRMVTVREQPGFGSTTIR